jgi:hypothetical protein
MCATFSFFYLYLEVLHTFIPFFAFARCCHSLLEDKAKKKYVLHEHIIIVNTFNGASID